MKKVFFAIAISAAFAACTGASSNKDAKVDSPKVDSVKVDSSKAVVDTTKKADTAKVAVDTAKKAK